MKKEERRELAKQILVGFVQSKQLSYRDSLLTFNSAIRKSIDVADSMIEKLNNEEKC